MLRLGIGSQAGFRAATRATRATRTATHAGLKTGFRGSLQSGSRLCAPARSFSTSRPQGQLFARFKSGVLVGVFAGMAFGIVKYFGDTVKLDAMAEPFNVSIAPETETVQPETKANPFPKTFSADGEQYDLVGLGVRTVSFISIHVYAVGLFIAVKDKAKAKQVLGADSTYDDLMDPDKGAAAFAKLLNAGVRLDIRIVPVRNTDFGHMRDGLVRTTMANPRFKAEGNNEEFGEGLAQLKRVFSRKMSVPKNNILHLNRDRDGTLRVTFFQGVSETSPKQVVSLGAVTVPLVSELLFLQYLSGAKPSSESLRQSAIKGFLTF